jgi:hypothetical protein
MNGMIDRMTHPSQDVDLLSRIDCRWKDYLLKKIPVHIIGTGEGEEEPFRFQQAKGLEINIFIPLATLGRAPFFLTKGGGPDPMCCHLNDYYLKSSIEARNSEITLSGSTSLFPGTRPTQDPF